MSWWIFAAQACLSLLSSSAGHSSASAEEKDRKALQEYNNKMGRIADAINQNAITTNVTLAIQQSAKQAQQIQEKAMQVTGAVEVQAAATSTVGRSVNQALKQVARGAANQEYARRQDLQAQFLQADEQRRQSALSAKMNEDHGYTPRPSAANALFGAAQGTLGAWGQNFGFGTYSTGGNSSSITAGNYGRLTGQGDTRTLLTSKYAARF